MPVESSWWRRSRAAAQVVLIIVLVLPSLLVISTLAGTLWRDMRFLLRHSPTMYRIVLNRLDGQT